MKGSTCTGWCFCNQCFCAVVLLFLCGAFVQLFMVTTLPSDAIRLFGGWAGPATASASPLTLLAATGAVGGLWLGFRQHGWAQPFFVALFGLFWVAVGHLTSPVFTLVGAAIVLGAAVWGALGYRVRT